MKDRTEVLALCLARGGYIKGARVAQFIGEWEMLTRVREGEWFSIDEFGEWWRDSPSTAYRRLRDFRAMFPELGEEGTPRDLMRPLVEAMAQGKRHEALDSVPLAWGTVT